MMLGALPIRVMVPPRIDPMARGRPKLPGLLPQRFDMRTAVGSIRPTAPTLFMMAESTAPTALILITCPLMLRRRRARACPSPRSRPELIMP